MNCAGLTGAGDEAGTFHAHDVNTVIGWTQLLYEYTVSKMSLILCRKLNHRNIELHHTSSGESVGVRRRNGEYRYVAWLGFLDRGEARERGQPVKLLVTRVGRSTSHGTVWRDLATGQHVQGCLTRQGAYAVIDTDVRILD